MLANGGFTVALLRYVGPDLAIIGASGPDDHGNAAEPAVAVGRTGRSLRSLYRPPLNGSIVGQTKW
jgi:hypothetical protein